MDPREALRSLEGARVGIYDLTTMPKAQLAKALEGPNVNGSVPLTIPGQSVVHMVPSSTIREILSIKISRTAYAV